MEKHDFEITVFSDADYEEIVPLREYLENPHVLDVELDLSSSAFILKSDHAELLGAEYDFGQLNLLAFQLEEVIERLDMQQIGLLRSAIHDNVYAPYLVFEPSEDSVLVSIIYFSDDFDNHFPIDNLIGNGRSEALYMHVRENLEAVLKGKPDDLYRPHFSRASYETVSLTKSIVKMVNEIKELYVHVGKDLKLEFYFHR